MINFTNIGHLTVATLAVTVYGYKGQPYMHPLDYILAIDAKIS
jgi:hypothetical protein